MSTELSPTKQIEGVLDLTQERFNNICTPAVRYEAERGFAMQVLNNNPYLMKVALGHKASLAQAITNVAAIGLSLNPAEKLAYLLPRTVKDSSGYVSKVFLEPSYMGLCKLATNSGAIEWIQANCAYKTDLFVDNGPGLRPTHTHDSFATAEERGPFKGVYCVAKTSGGDYLTTVMTAEKVSDIMERSETVKSYRKNNNNGFGGPWITDFIEQAKKTVVRNASKMWPKSNGVGSALSEAINLSNENEGFEPMQTSPDIKNFTGDQKTYYDQLIEQNRAVEMYVLLSTVEEAVRNNLYHSFKKGEKGRYQKIVDALYQNGFSIFTDCVDEINRQGINNDDLGVMELIEDFSQEVMDFMSERLNPEAMAIINQNKA